MSKNGFEKLKNPIKLLKNVYGPDSGVVKINKEMMHRKGKEWKIENYKQNIKKVLNLITFKFRIETFIHNFLARFYLHDIPSYSSSYYHVQLYYEKIINVSYRYSNNT